MKKFLSLSLALIMIFSVMSVSIISASAEELTKSLTSSEIEIARIKGVSFDKVAEVTRENARRLFGI